MENQGLYKAILYSRVSTTNDEQAESIENQILLAKNYLAKHPNIVMAEPLDKYSEKISGKTDRRPKFQEMCQRLSRGDIHYLMIKDMKRLSRSVETTYAFFNLMKQYGFEIIQLSTGSVIDDKSFEGVESNLLLGVEALFAQNMVLTQSRYGRTVHKVRCENKILAYKDSTLFGYKWDPQLKDIVIDEEKAEIVRELFKRYVFRDEGIVEIKEYLSIMGYPYSYVTVSKWLQEGKYIGDWTINRKGSVLGIGQGAKTRRFDKDKSEWIHIDRPDLAIVDKDVFEMAQEIRSSRIRHFRTDEGKEKKIGSFVGHHLFANKVFCADCGSSYRFRWGARGHTNPVYIDSFRVSKRDLSQKCPNVLYKRVTEKELKRIVVGAISAVNMQGAESIEVMIRAVSSAIRSNIDMEEKRQREEQTLKFLDKEAEKVSNAFIDATSVMRDRLNKQLEDIEKQIDACKRRLQRMDNQLEEEEELRCRFSSIKRQVSGWIDIVEESLDRKMVEKLVSKILIHHDGKVEVFLELSKMASYQTSLNKPEPMNSEEVQQIELPPDDIIKANVQKVFTEVERDEPSMAVLDIVSFSRGNDENTGRVVVKLDTRQC
jgi:DNA invertase Pin-like site-specific DNA recombinase